MGEAYIESKPATNPMMRLLELRDNADNHADREVIQWAIQQIVELNALKS